MIPADNPLVPPGYWMHETSGVLKPVIQKFLAADDLTGREIHILRLYFQQWIDSPVWDKNPHATESSRLALQKLRDDAKRIECVDDAMYWIHAAQHAGMDPL